MTCKYCELIHSFDKRYPLREATRDLKSDYPRCEWHWRFVCSICGKPRHFNGIAWCEKTQEFTCIKCGEEHRAVRRAFWSWKYYYEIKCKACEKRHAALDRLEFLGKHPWQLHSEMRKKRAGLSDEVDLPEVSSTFLPLKEGAVSERQIAKAWDKGVEFWNRRYTEFGDMNRQFVIDPAIFRMLGSVRGLRILDAGCGNGYLCRLLAKKGAKVSGVDISKRFIQIARKKEKEAPLGIDYHVSSICDLKMFGDGTFDVVVSNLVLMDLTDLNKAFSEFCRVLKPNGKLVFSIMHPCFSSPPVRGWVRVPRDSARKEDWLFWKVDRYFDRLIEVWRYFDSPPLYSFHRTLSDYVKALLNNGFIITDFDEPVPSKAAMTEHYREFANEYDRIPWFLVIGAKASQSFKTL